MKQTSNKVLILGNPFSIIFLVYVLYMIYFSFIHGSDYGFISGIACFFGFFISYLAGGSIGTGTTKNTFRIEFYLIGIVMSVVGYFLLNFSKAKLGLFDNLDTQFQTIVWAIVNAVIGILATRESVKRNQS
jgi:hypothetical protein